MPSYECAVCQSDMVNEEISTLQCGHVMHHLCLSEWFKINKTCPICRQKGKQIIKLFLTSREEQYIQQESQCNVQALKSELEIVKSSAAKYRTDNKNLLNCLKELRDKLVELTDRNRILNIQNEEYKKKLEVEVHKFNNANSKTERLLSKVKSLTSVQAVLDDQRDGEKNDLEALDKSTLCTVILALKKDLKATKKVLTEQESHAYSTHQSLLMARKHIERLKAEALHKDQVMETLKNNIKLKETEKPMQLSMLDQEVQVTTEMLSLSSLETTSSTSACVAATVNQTTVNNDTKSHRKPLDTLPQNGVPQKRKIRMGFQRSDTEPLLKACKMVSRRCAQPQRHSSLLPTTESEKLEVDDILDSLMSEEASNSGISAPNAVLGQFSGIKLNKSSHGPTTTLPRRKFLGTSTASTVTGSYNGLGGHTRIY